MSSPWRKSFRISRGYTKHYRNTFIEEFDTVIPENKCLDLDTKKAALKASPSIVSLESHTGGERLFICSGTILDCENVNGRFYCTILTSASLLRSNDDEPKVADDLKVDVYAYISVRRSFEGQLLAFDFNYNIAIVKIESDVPILAAIVREIDDSMSIDPSEICSTSFWLRRHGDTTATPNLFNLGPGDKVIALGRHYESLNIMAAPGVFSLYCLDKFDCEELLRASCKIKSGIGGPLINYYGEVIGINFYTELCTPFLPINIASKCLEHLKKYGRVCRPWLGVKVTNLYTESLSNLEQIIQTFPDIFKGVVVEEVISGSPADCAGLCPLDIIVGCNGNLVGSFLEFFGIMWDKAGKPLEMDVRRVRDDCRMNLTMIAKETNPDKYNRWPVSKPTPGYRGRILLKGQV